MMKKKILFIAITVIMIIIAGFMACKSPVNKKTNEMNDSIDVSEKNAVQNDLNKSAQITYIEQKSLEEAISDSYTILMGTFIGSEKSSEIDNLSYYKFTVNECLKGSIPVNEIVKVEAYDEVVFVGNKSFYEKGKDYIILLDKFESVYIDDKYMPNGNFLISVEKDSIKEIFQKGTIYEIEANYTVSRFRNVLKTTLNKTDSYGIALGNRYTTSTNIDEIVEYSDLIIEAKIIENLTPKGFEKNEIGIYSIEILDVKKGTYTGLDAIYLFKSEVTIGDKYLFMISYPSTKYEEAYSISSKSSCIPVKDTEKYEEYMQYINK